MMNYDYKHRLKIDQIKNHPYLSDVDWDIVLNKYYKIDSDLQLLKVDRLPRYINPDVCYQELGGD